MVRLSPWKSNPKHTILYATPSGIDEKNAVAQVSMKYVDIPSNCLDQEVPLD